MYTARSRGDVEAGYRAAKTDLQAVPLRKPLRPLRVGIVGEFYTAMEAFSNLELEQKLINYVSVGDREQSEQILQTIYQINFKDVLQPPKFVNCLLFDILGTVLKIMADLDIDSSLILPNGR